MTKENFLKEAKRIRSSFGPGCWLEDGYPKSFIKENKSFFSDKEVALELIKMDKYLFEMVDEQLKQDFDFMMQAIKVDLYFLKEYKDKSIFDNKEIMTKLANENIDAMNFASERLKNDLDFMNIAFNKGRWGKLEMAGPDIKDNKELMLKAVRCDDFALFYASERLRADREVVLEALKINDKAKDFVKNVSKREFDEGHIGLDISLSARALTDLKLATPLQYASKELRADREIVLEAVKHSGSNLEYASDELKDDKEVVLEAVKQHPFAINFASKRLQNDTEIGIEYAKRDEIRMWGRQFEDNKEVMLVAIERSVFELQGASERLRDDFEFALTAFRVYRNTDSDNWVNEHISERLKNNDDFKILAKYVCKEIKLDEVLDGIDLNNEEVYNLLIKETKRMCEEKIAKLKDSMDEEMLKEENLDLKLKNMIDKNIERIETARQNKLDNNVGC